MRGQVLTDGKISRLVKSLGLWVVPHGFRSSFRDARDPPRQLGRGRPLIWAQTLEESPCTYPLVLPGPVPPEDAVDNRLPRKALDGIFD